MQRQMEDERWRARRKAWKEYLYTEYDGERKNGVGSHATTQ